MEREEYIAKAVELSRALRDLTLAHRPPAAAFSAFCLKAEDSPPMLTLLLFVRVAKGWLQGEFGHSDDKRNYPPIEEPMKGRIISAANDMEALNRCLGLGQMAFGDTRSIAFDFLSEKKLGFSGDKTYRPVDFLPRGAEILARVLAVVDYIERERPDILQANQAIENATVGEVGAPCEDYLIMPQKMRDAEGIIHEHMERVSVLAETMKGAGFSADDFRAPPSPARA